MSKKELAILQDVLAYFLREKKKNKEEISEEYKILYFKLISEVVGEGE